MRFDLNNLPKCITCGRETMTGIPMSNNGTMALCPPCMTVLTERIGPVPVIPGTVDKDWAEYNRRYLEEMKKLAEENGVLPKKEE